MMRWPLALLGIAFGCQAETDPLYGTRAAPAAVRRPGASPRPQVMVAPTEPQPSGSSSDASAEPGAQEGTEPEASRTEQQRRADELAYEDGYLRQKERLIPDQLGRWVAISGGRLLPADSRGRLQPAATMDEALEAANAADPQSLHRYLFRVGEEGDVVYADSSSQPRNVVGASFKAALKITATFDAKTQALRWARGDKSHEFELDAGRMSLLVGDPANRQSLSVRIDDSAGFGGFLALEPTFAALADAARFEIPGRVLLKTPRGVEPLRRARIRVKVRELDVDELVPVAVWPD